LLLARVSSPLRFNADLKRDLEADWLHYLTSVQPAFDALVNDFIVAAISWPNVRIQMQDPDAGRSGEIAIICKKRAAFGRKSRNQLKGIRCLNSCCSPELRRSAQMVARDICHFDSTATCENGFIAPSQEMVS